MATQLTTQSADLTCLIPTILEKFYVGVTEKKLRQYLHKEMRINFSLAEFTMALNSCLTVRSISIHFEVDAEPAVLVPLLSKKQKI